MKIKFLQDKGCVKVGYIGDYPETQAQTLIKNGFAEEVKEKPKTKAKIKETDNG